MQPYPAITQSDPMQQMLAQVLGGYKPGQLGAAPTLGNEEGQQDYARQLAEALAQQQSAESGLGMADRLSQAEYAPNSGALGSIAMLAQAYAGKKLRGKESASQADAMAKAYGAQAGMGEQRASSERSRRSMVAQQLELTKREAAEFMETGKIPEAKRDRLQAIMSSQGLAIANLDQNSYTIPQEDTGQQQSHGGPFQIEGDVPPQVRAAMQADPAAWESGSSIDIPEQRQQGGPLLPYEKPPSAIELEKLDLMRRSAGRADAAETRAQEAARVAAEAAKRKANAPNAALEQWVQARKGLEEGLGRTTTGPIMGKLPAFTTDQQIAEGSVAVTAPILKQLFRTAGEGTFTDKDQELLMQMVPTRNDTEEARKWKIENMDRVIRAKLGAGAPAAGNDDALIRKYLP